jgi:hypothetical protein
MRRRHRSGSRVAAAVNAVRRHRRRLAKRDQPKASIRTSTAVAIREAQPRTLSGLAAQVATVGAMDTTAAAWRHRIALAPVAATAAVLPAAAWAPGATATGLVVTGLAGLLAAQAEHPARRRRRGLAWWSGGVLVWMGAGAVGATGHLIWWQDLVVLAAAAAPGAIAWWRPQPAPEPELLQPEALEQAAPMWIPPAALLLGQTLEHVCGMDRSPIYGARVEQVTSPADGVAVAVVALPGGMHASQIRPGELEPGLEALLDRAGVSQLGHLQRGAVRVEPADPALGVTRIQVTASWSRALDEGILAWTPPEDLAPGLSWLGVDDARQPLVVPSFETGADGKVSAIHTWVIGRNGGGKSTTLRTLLVPGIKGGWELLILVDGKGDSLDELAPYAAGGAVARAADAWRQAIALAYAIMVARQQRLGTPQAWRGPTPTDPLITLVIDECATVLAGLTGIEVAMMTEMGRMGRSLGVRTIQSGQIPLVDTVIGGSDWRSQARLILGHGVQDAVHDRIATQSGGAEGPSLLGLPKGRLVAMLDGRLIATRARVALLAEDELTAAVAGSPRAVLSEADRTDHVQTLVDLAASWGTIRPQAIVDLDELLAPWATTTLGPADGSGSGGRAGTPAPVTTSPAATGGVPAQPRPATGGARGGRPDGRLRQLVLTHVLTHAGVTRTEVRDHAVQAGYSASGAYKEINQLLEDGAVREDDQGRLIATLWDHHQVPAAAVGGAQ